MRETETITLPKIKVRKRGDRTTQVERDRTKYRRREKYPLDKRNLEE